MLIAPVGPRHGGGEDRKGKGELLAQEGTRLSVNMDCVPVEAGTRAPVGPWDGEVRTTNERLGSWCARRRGCSPRGTLRMCSFWISSMLPMAMLASLASARLSGKLALLKDDMKFTCAYAHGIFSSTPPHDWQQGSGEGGHAVHLREHLARAACSEHCAVRYQRCAV